MATDSDFSRLSESAQRTKMTMEARLDALHEDLGEIKISLRELSQALSKLAVVEQRLDYHNQALDRAFKLVDAGMLRISAIEVQLPLLKQSSGWLEKLLLAIAGGAITFVVSMVLAK